MLWDGDGRITAGHLAILRELVRTGRLGTLTLFDGWSDVGWSLREASMSERILMAEIPDSGTLVVAGNMHTPMTETTLGLPLGARLAEKRPGVREIQIRYGNGGFYNARPRKFKSHLSLRRHVRLHTEHGQLVLELPVATEAAVPHRVGPASAGPAREVTWSPWGTRSRGHGDDGRGAPGRGARRARRGGVRRERARAPGGRRVLRAGQRHLAAQR